MARSKEERTRLNLSISSKVRARLDELEKMSDSENTTEVIRRAIAVYDHILTEQTERDAHVVLKYPSDEERFLVFK